MTDKPTITQDYHAATKAFDNVLGHAGSYAEYVRPSDREAGVRSLTQDLANHRESSVAELQAEVERLRKAIAEATISLKAIGQPQPHDPPDAHICGVIARSALVRIEEALDQKEPVDDSIHI